MTSRPRKKELLGLVATKDEEVCFHPPLFISYLYKNVSSPQISRVRHALSSHQQRLAIALDTLEAMQQDLATERKARERLNNKLVRLKDAVRAAEAERDDLREVVVELAEKIELSRDDFSALTWAPSRLRLPDVLEPLQTAVPIPALASDTDLWVYASATISSLRHALAAERLQHEETRRIAGLKIERLHAQVARLSARVAEGGSHSVVVEHIPEEYQRTVAENVVLEEEVARLEAALASTRLSAPLVTHHTDHVTSGPPPMAAGTHDRRKNSIRAKLTHDIAALGTAIDGFAAQRTAAKADIVQSEPSAGNLHDSSADRMVNPVRRMSPRPTIAMSDTTRPRSSAGSSSAHPRTSRSPARKRFPAVQSTEANPSGLGVPRTEAEIDHSSGEPVNSPRETSSTEMVLDPDLTIRPSEAARRGEIVHPSPDILASLSSFSPGMPSNARRHAELDDEIEVLRTAIEGFNEERALLTQQIQSQEGNDTSAIDPNMTLLLAPAPVDEASTLDRLLDADFEGEMSMDLATPLVPTAYLPPSSMLPHSPPSPPTERIFVDNDDG
ncbi:unnamed protein product [Mycena citricolor]|uniref:Uncharacterized protein n=1 Tax=Mycena citricolor TaxID=2018698 RepID=A0AAD2H866_9AGAR|nr:unnamed protein product [Mycena citricolor]